MSILSTFAYQMYTNEYKSDLALTSKGSVYAKKIIDSDINWADKLTKQSTTITESAIIF